VIEPFPYPESYGWTFGGRVAWIRRGYGSVTLRCARTDGDKRRDLAVFEARFYNVEVRTLAWSAGGRRLVAEADESSN
jgi:hypothetical protein